MENRQADVDSTIKLYRVIIAAIAVFCYFFAVKGMSDTHSVSNILLYMGALCLFVAVYFAGLLLKKVNLSGKKNTAISFVLVMVVCVVWLVRAYREEMVPEIKLAGGYLRHNMPVGFYIVVLGLVVVTVFLTIKKTVSGNNLLRGAIGIVFIIMETMFLYAPNILNDTSGGVYHADAYINTIVNILNKTPYEIYTLSIYGHYGLFYYLPVKLLTVVGVNQWIAITVTVAFFGCVCFCAETILLHKTLKNDAVFVMALLANAVINTQIYKGQYWQLNPHRILFPSLTLLLCYFYCRGCSEGRKISVWLWIISGCSFIWNTETGTICILICCLAHIYKECQRAKKIEGKIILKNLGCFIVTFFLAWICVSIYNLLCGGDWISIKTFIYPIGSSEYVVEDLWLPLGTPFRGYYFAVILFLGVFCYSLKGIFSLNADAVDVTKILAAIMGLGVLPYYMNRAVDANISIVAFEIALLLSVLLDENAWLVQNPKVAIKTAGISFGIYTIGGVVLSAMCLMTLGSCGEAIRTYYAGDYNTETLKVSNQKAIDIIGDSTNIVYIGNGAAIYSSMMDRPKGIYMIDFEDINPQGIEYVLEQLAAGSYDYIFCDESSAGWAIPEGYIRASEEVVFPNVNVAGNIYIQAK